MSAVWGLALSDSDMLILLALADWSNDHGECWPSIAQLVDKTRKSERTIQGAIKSLCEAGHMTRTYIVGRGCRYTIHPRSDCAPAATAPRSRRAPADSAPPQPLPETPAAAAPNTSETTNNPVQATPSQAERETVDDDRLTEDEVVEAWNDVAEKYGLAKVRGKLSPERRQKLKARIRAHPIEDWKEAFAAIGRSPFLRGEQGNWRGAHFDFLLQPSSFQKMIEGVYDRAAH